jgi:mono/diheme cytochrome c family protein
LVSPLGAQEVVDEEEPFLPGLVATFRDARGNTAKRLDHQLAFHWGQVSPDPRLETGAFRATWQGRILVAPRGAYRFFAFGTGEIELKIAGRVVLARQTVQAGWLASEPVELSGDYHPLELSFRRTGSDAQLMLLWSGPDFGLEPIPPRSLFHPRETKIEGDFERGRLLAQVLRCGRCHGDEPAPPAAPALDHLSGNLSREWLAEWLRAGEQTATQRSPRRMPAFGLSEVQAKAIADWLLKPRASEPRASASDPQSPLADARGSDRAIKHGERLFMSLGCLACHTWRDLGASGWLGGGDLTHIADKRPPRFFAAWLAESSRLNRDHRMPVFQLSEEERAALSLFLSAQKASGGPLDSRPVTPASLL